MVEGASILEDIRDIFSILHDGRTDGCAGDKNLLMLKVDADHLANRIDPNYTSFFIWLTGITKCEFTPWENPDLQPRVMTDLEMIFRHELEILQADIENDCVKIACSQHGHEAHYWGGTILLRCTEIKVFDEGKRLVTIEELDKICNDFWDEVRKSTEKYVLEEWARKKRK